MKYNANAYDVILLYKCKYNAVQMQMQIIKSANEPMPMQPFYIGSLKQHRACGVVTFKRIQI